MAKIAVNLKKIIKNIVRVVLPLLLGGGIMYWMYRDLDMASIRLVLEQDVRWGWLLLSIPFGVMAQVLRAVRWKLALAPLDDKVRLSTSIYAVFISYMASLVIPRVGEVMRCGLLKRYDKSSFTQSLGTVVTERMVDMWLMLLISVAAILIKLPFFRQFFHETGVSFSQLLARFTSTGYLMLALCGVAAALLFWVLAKRLSLFTRLGGVVQKLKAGMLTFKTIQHPIRYWLCSVGIWVGYFFHFYLTLYGFSFTEHLGADVGLVAFVVGTIAVIVPTPNGAGPWHFAIKTVLVLYGVAANQAVLFALLVHSMQTLLIIILGLLGLIGLQFVSLRRQAPTESLSTT